MVTANEGLDALAALASAVPVPDAGNDNETKNAARNATGGGQQQPIPSDSLGSGGSNNSGSNTTPGAAPPVPQPQSAFQATASNPQWQQALAASANAGNNGAMANNNNNNVQLSVLTNLHRQFQQADPSALMAIQQQLNYFQLLQLAQQNQQQQQQLLPPPLPQQQTAQVNPQLQALQLALAGRNIPGLANLFTGAASSTVDNRNNNSSMNMQQSPQQAPTPAGAPPQVLPTAPIHNMSSSMSTSSANSMPPPPPASSILNISKATTSSSSQHASIAPQPDHIMEREFEGTTGDRKIQKRAANRKSAQLSRKRKKQFIEELKDENDGLRRKEQILKSIPDLIVVFDSSGKLWFVSESVSRFLDFSAGELEGTSFWDRLCDDSVRLLKAAFMDSLAARQPESDTASLGSGFWELRLVDKDGVQKVVTLNGVVHFAGDRPECVCSIRPHEDHMPSPPSSKVARKEKGTTANLANDSTSDSSSSSQKQPAAAATKKNHHYSSSSMHKSLIRVKPQQSVVSNDRSSSDSSSFMGKRREGSIRISDSCNSSGISDSGSSDENNNDTAS